jgi:type I restriction enzyme S subunit
MSAAIPGTWSIAPVGSLAKVVGGGTPPSQNPENFAAPGAGIPWLTPADLSGYRKQSIQHGTRDLTCQGLKHCSAALMPRGTVLFSSRAPIGYVAIAANEISTNQGFKSFIFAADIDSRFAYYQLRYLKPIAEAIATGTTFKELSGSAAAKLPFAIAPTNEQTRIADKLDTVLARVDACRDRLARVAPLLKRFRQSVLAAATSGRLTEDWRIENDGLPPHAATLGDAIRVSSGSGLTAKEMAINGHIPVYGGNGVNGYHNESNIGVETIVIGRVGYYCGAVHLTPKEAWVTDNALIVRFDESLIDKRFLYWLLSGTDLRRNDSSTAQPVISGTKIYGIGIKIPNLLGARPNCKNPIQINRLDVKFRIEESSL